MKYAVIWQNEPDGDWVVTGWGLGKEQFFDSVAEADAYWRNVFEDARKPWRIVPQQTLLTLNKEKKWTRT